MPTTNVVWGNAGVSTFSTAFVHPKGLAALYGMMHGQQTPGILTPLALRLGLSCHFCTA